MNPARIVRAIAKLIFLHYIYRIDEVDGAATGRLQSVEIWSELVVHELFVDRLRKSLELREAVFGELVDHIVVVLLLINNLRRLFAWFPRWGVVESLEIVCSLTRRILLRGPVRLRNDIVQPGLPLLRGGRHLHFNDRTASTFLYRARNLGHS